MTSSPRLALASVEAALGPDVKFLGAGTFGDTWRRGDRAFKILCGSPQEPARVQREVEALRRVRHNNVVRMYGVHDTAVDGKVYQVLEFEYIEGGDVQEKTAADRWPNPSEVHAFAVALLSGLLAIHESGTVHRDLKPANIAVRGGEWSDPVILDLGLSKPFDASTLTIYPDLVGTPLYMAPEQLRGERAVKAFDLFAVGVVLYLLLARRHPFYSTGEMIDIPTFRNRQRDFVMDLRDVPNVLLDTIDRLLSFAQFRRGSAKSNLRRLGKY